MLIAFSVAPSGPPPVDLLVVQTVDPLAGQATDAGEHPGRSTPDSIVQSDSVSAAVAAAVQVVRASGLPHRTDAMFTTIEGDWDECMDVVRRATEAVGSYGSRVSLVLKADIRPGWTGELTAKLDRLEVALDQLT